MCILKALSNSQQLATLFSSFAPRVFERGSACDHAPFKKCTMVSDVIPEAFLKVRTNVPLCKPCSCLGQSITHENSGLSLRKQSGYCMGDIETTGFMKIETSGLHLLNHDPQPNVRGISYALNLQMSMAFCPIYFVLFPLFQVSKLAPNCTDLLLVHWHDCAALVIPS